MSKTEYDLTKAIMFKNVNTIFQKMKSDGMGSVLSQYDKKPDTE